MREDYQKNLNRIADLSDRKLLRDILNSVIAGVIEYDEEMFRLLEERIFGEYEYQEMRYSVHTSLIKREDYDPIHEWLFPMNMTDVEGIVPDLSTYAENTQEAVKPEIFIGRIFLECDYIKIQELLHMGAVYQGMITTDGGEYPAKFKIKKSMHYLEQIKELYESYQRNSIPWVTVNCPYIFKFIDVILLECDKKAAAENFLSYSIDLGRLKEYQRYDRIPLWNIESYLAKSMVFPRPILDGINYEHVLPIKNSSEGSGYIVAVPDNLPCYMKQGKDVITVAAPIETMCSFKVLRIVPKNDEFIGSGLYPLMSNQMKNSFINRLEGKSSAFVRTKAELKRLVHSFQASEGLELVDFKIIKELPDVIESYNMNYFIIDGIREGSDKKCMCLYFQRRKGKREVRGGEAKLFERDAVSFLVSVIQTYFSEYSCVGCLEEKFSEEDIN